MAVGQIVNLLRGSVALEVTGPFPERFLNLCAQGAVAFWRAEQPDETTLRLTVAWQDRGRLEELAERTGCTIREVKKGGLPPFLLRFRQRYALMAGLGLALAAVCLLSRVVFVVEVEGNVAVPRQVILSELSRQGLKPGAYGPNLAIREMCNNALLHLPDLSWMTVNLHGIRAQVVVRERLEEPKPVDETILGDIVARAPALVTEMEVWSGDPAVKEGSTVLPGEVLIRGSVRMDPPQYSELPVEWMPVRAMGQVTGRTWRTLTAAVDLTAQVKRWTGEEKIFWSATILGQRVNFYGNSGISPGRYDKINQIWSLPQKEPLLTLKRETCRGYELDTCPVDPVQAQTMLEGQLMGRLEALLGQTGELVSHSFSARQEDGRLVVTLTAECKEELGRFVPAP